MDFGSKLKPVCNFLLVNIGQIIAFDWGVPLCNSVVWSDLLNLECEIWPKKLKT